MAVFEKIKEKVKYALNKHEGGVEYFDTLDELLRSDDMIEFMSLLILLDLICFDEPIQVVSTGSFGRALLKKIGEDNYNDKYDINVIIVEGGLRKGDKSLSINNKPDVLTIIVDDSLYSGNTVRTIVNGLVNKPKRISMKFLYNGMSKDKYAKLCEEFEVESIFNYWQEVEVEISENKEQ